MQKNIIIFGGSGFVGQHLVRYFNQTIKEATIFNADLVAPEKQTGVSRWMQGDIRKPLDMKSITGKIDAIINLAAVHKSPGHPSHEYFETNILGARNICDFAEKADCKKIVFTSSIAPYGPSEDEKTEESIPMPVIPYGISKIIAEGIHKEWLYKGPGRQLFILRPAVIFGMGEKGNFTRMATTLRKGIFVYPGRKNTIKACVYVKDVCRVIEFAMNRNEQFNIFNVCYAEKTSTEDIARAFHEALGFKMPKTVIPKSAIDGGAALLRMINTPFIRSLGLDPARIAKLVNSTNISSKKLVEAGFAFKYDPVSAIKDWSSDCNGKTLF